MKTMKWLNSPNQRLRAGVGLAVVAAAIYTASVAFVLGAGTESEKEPAKKERDGAQLYQINCARCHSERYPTERTDAQWKTIMLHMRTRAQIPAKDSKAILKYLQENN